MNYPRRLVMRRVFQLAVAGVVASRLAPAAWAEESCVDHSTEGLRESLKYVSVSPDPKKTCSACAFFTADAGKPACGNCMIMTGLVDAKGHCESWSAKE